MKQKLNVDFEIVHELLSYCSLQKGRTIGEIKYGNSLNTPQMEVLNHTVDFMIKRKLLLKVSGRVQNGKKCPDTWVKNPALNSQVLRKAA